MKKITLTQGKFALVDDEDFDRKSNLRTVTRRQNACNRKLHRDNSSGFRGVNCHSQVHKWMARISYKNKQIYLGMYQSVIDAAETYDIAAYHLHGAFARFNFPNGENL